VGPAGACRGVLLCAVAAVLRASGACLALVGLCAWFEAFSGFGACLRGFGIAVLCWVYGVFERGCFMGSALMDLGGVSDSVLVCELERLCKADRVLCAELIVHLGEVLERRLFLGLGFSSMFEYCRAGLGMSEAEAYLRIQAARVGRAFPLVLERLGAGALNLTAIKLIAPHLTVENHVRLLDRVRGLSKRKVEEVVAELAPKPDVPARVRKLPKHASTPQASGAGLFAGLAESVPATSASSGTAELRTLHPTAPSAADAALAAHATHAALAAHATHAALAAPATPAALAAPAASAASTFATASHTPAARSVPLSPGRFKLEATLDQEEFDALEQLRELLRHQIPNGDIARVVGRALKALCKSEMKRRFAQSSPAPVVHRAPDARRAPDAGQELDAPSTAAVGGYSGAGLKANVDVDSGADLDASDSVDGNNGGGSGTKTGSGSRYIPRGVLREVYARDSGQCTFVSAEGRRCASRGFLEVHHHEVTFARGGAATVENLRLTCRAHNLFIAESDYGRGFMQRKLQEAADRRLAR
jgi:hypothetical protein